MGRKKYPSRLIRIGDGVRYSYSMYRCSCGVEKEIYTAHVNNGSVASCGCLRKEILAAGRHSHAAKGQRRRGYTCWVQMVSRCTDPKCEQYNQYGGKGITVCNRWLVFDNFIADMGPRPTLGHSIDRKDNKGNYEPSNCRWATRTEQNRNKNDNHRVEWRGETKCLAEWEEVTGISQRILWDRLVRYKWLVEDAMTKPIRKLRNNKVKNVLETSSSGSDNSTGEYGKVPSSMATVV